MCALKCTDERDLWDEFQFSTQQAQILLIAPNVMMKLIQHLRNKYNDLYNSVSYNIDDIKNVLNEFDCELNRLLSQDDVGPFSLPCAQKWP